MNCPACGADNREGANFCRICGEHLAEHAQSKALVPGKEKSILPGDAAVSETEVVETGERPESEAGTEGVVIRGDAPGAEPLEPPIEDLFAGPLDEVPQEALPEAEAEELAAGRDSMSGKDGLSAETEMEMEVAAGEGSEAPTRPDRPISIEAQRGDVKDSLDEATESAPGEPAAEPIGALASIDALAEAGTAQSREDATKTEPGNVLALEPGTVIDGRFELVGVLDDEPGETLYLAHDLLRCWQCGFVANELGEAFCGQCGASTERKLQVRLLEVQSLEAGPSNGEAIAGAFDHEARHFLLLAEPEAETVPEGPAPSIQDAPQNVRLVVGQRSDAGRVRELDEDSLLVLTVAPTYQSWTGPVLGLFAVADGMGGHEGGEVASRMALQVLAGEVLRHIVLPLLAEDDLLEEGLVARLRQATERANDAVYLARQKRGNDMGTTLTAALFKDDRLLLAHVGDCRAYRWSAEGLQQLTKDHSLVASMIASGQASPEEIYTHPHRSVIFRCIGDLPVVEVDTGVVSVVPGDRVILCCDGLWEMVRDEGIVDVMMQEADPQAACDLLVKHANVAGGDDNISLIIVQVESV